jgi:predicted nucleic acid-binding protein
MEHGLGVVTRNVADFERAGIQILDPWRQTA